MARTSGTREPVAQGRLWILVVLLVVGAGGHLYADDALSDDALADDAEEALTLEIRSIELVSHNVFDEPAEGWAAPYTVANKVHARTRESVVRRELLFEAGETLNRERIEQTERNLRSLPFVRDARVEATLVDEDGNGLAEQVDVRVETWDRWSLAPVIQFRQTGEHTVWEAGLSHKSLFGYGKEITLSRRQTLDRTLDRLSYYDPQVAGSRFGLGASVADLSDGYDRHLVVGRPYYSVFDTWSMSVQAGTFRRQDPLFQDGAEVGRLDHRGEWGHVEVGRAIRRRSTSALRMHVGYRSRREQVGATRRDFGIVEVGIRSVEHRYRQLTHVNRFEQTEDFNLGSQWYGTLGVSTPAFGGGDDRVLFTTAGHSQGFAIRSDQLLVVGGAITARRHRVGWANVLGQAHLRYLRKRSPRRALIGRIDFRAGHNLDPEVQVLLGAESGLRGYPVRQFVGTRSLLLSAEQRWFVVDDLFQLLSMGVAAFVDSGVAWGQEEAVDLSDLRTAVGASLLVGSNRLSSSGGARVDVGYALNPVQNAGRWVLFAGSDISF